MTADDGGWDTLRRCEVGFYCARLFGARVPDPLAPPATAPPSLSPFPLCDADVSSLKQHPSLPSRRSRTGEGLSGARRARARELRVGRVKQTR